MKILDVKGREISISVAQSRYPIKEGSKSKQQAEIGKMLCRLYPSTAVLEEFTVPGSRMSVDFFIPSKQLVFEVQGRQHEEHVEFFHGDRKYSKSFGEQRKRDVAKANWCEINGFILIEIPHNVKLDKKGLKEMIGDI